MLGHRSSRAPLFKPGSPAILEEGGVTRHMRGASIATLASTAVPIRHDSPVAVAVALRRVRLAALVLLLVLVIGALMALFQLGVELERFDANSKSPDEQNQLLDDYNSYSGNAVSVFGRPIELCVAAVVQVVLLRILRESTLRLRPTWMSAYVALSLAATVTYLINNGFNALNMQLRSMEVHPVVSTSDLRPSSPLSAVARSANVADTRSEFAPRNPLTNTVLRTLVLPRVPKSAPQCDWATSQKNFKAVFSDDMVEFGFAQREWQSRLLSETPQANSTRVSGASANASSTDALPMDTTLAADLFLHAMFLAYDFLPWQVERTWFNERATRKRFPEATEGTNLTLSAARIAGILPDDPDASEKDKQQSFVRHSTPLLARRAPRSVMEFSHVQSAPQITFDALTIDVPVDDCVSRRLSPATTAHTTRLSSGTPSRRHGRRFAFSPSQATTSTTTPKSPSSPTASTPHEARNSWPCCRSRETKSSTTCNATANPTRPC